MKALIVFFAIWIFVVPAAVALFLISTVVAVRTPDLYFAFTALALALSILVMVSGHPRLEPFLNASVRLFPKTQKQTNSIQEIKHEKSLEGRIRS